MGHPPPPSELPPPFQPFDHGKETQITRQQLPHWVQNGVTYFVTFRLADSWPKPLLERWTADRARWLELHDIVLDEEGHWRRKLEKLPEEQRLEFRDRFTAVFERMLDEGRGTCVLRRDDCRRIVTEALTHFHGERCWLRAFVVMPNHVHALVTLQPSHELKAILHSWKRFSARRINEILDREGSLWQSESWDHIVRDEAALAKFSRYIQENPMKAGIQSGFTLR